MNEKKEKKVKSKSYLLIIAISIAVIGVFFFLFLLLLGNLSSPLDNMKIPSYSGKEKPILEAFEKQFSKKEDFIYSSALKGEHRSPVMFIDLDNDARDEALVFYSLKKAEKNVYIKIMKENNGSWIAINDIRGNGNKIISVDKLKASSNSTENYLMIYWDVLGSGKNGLLTVYVPEKYSDKNINLKPLFKQNILGYTKISIDENLTPGILFYFINYTEKNIEAYANVFCIEDDRVVTLGDNVKIDNSVNNCINLQTFKKIDGEYIYLDTANQYNSSLTEILVWDYKQRKLESLFTKVGNFSNYKTLRSVEIESADIDRDREPEIPSNKSEYNDDFRDELNYGEELLPVIAWSTVDRNFNLTEKFLTFAETDSGYLMKTDLNKEYKIFAIRNSILGKTEYWTLRNGKKNKLLFTIYDTELSRYNDNTQNYSDFFIYGAINNKMIMFKITDDGAKLGINEDYIKSNIENIG
ncbi:MAG: hypothetical protein Q4E28_02765 [Clostridia bacterium]|nr:hypothetical protein [Clostridia bacterium]